MNPVTEYFKEIFNKLNTTDMILNAILSFCISVVAFYLFLPNPGYSSLKDFFVGETIYADYNKYFDLLFVFLYVILFFMLLLFYKKIKTAVFEQKIIRSRLTNNIIYPLQYLSLLGYFIIYPFDGHLYKGLLVIVLMLICAGIYDIRRLQKIGKNDGLIHFSIFSITAVVLLCFGRFYCTQNFRLDAHHDAEHFSTYYMHTVHKMSYYKDIMLVHGGRDLSESWLAQHLLGTNNLYTYLLGKTLFFNIVVILFTFLSLFVFDKKLIALLPLISLYRNDETTTLLGIYFLVFFILLKDKIFNNASIFLSLYLLFTFIFFQFWTTFGILWAVSFLPAVIYRIIQTCKQKDFKQLIIPSIVLFAGLVLFAQDIYYFSKQAGFYTAGNLYGFGTVLPALNIKKYFIYFRLAAILALPSFILLFLKEFFKETKNIKYLYVLVFSILFVMLSLNYSLGRIDNTQFSRIFIISINTLFVIIPFLLYVKRYSCNVLKYVILVSIFLFLTTFAVRSGYVFLFQRVPQQTENNLKIETILNSKNDTPVNCPLYSPQDNITISDGKKMKPAFLCKTILFANKYIDKDDTFLDLTNNGILYYLFDKKIPMPYTSYFNIVSYEQAKYVLQKLQSKLPDKILIKSEEQPLDNVYPSLRINPVYRHILINENYKTLTDETGMNVLLVKTAKKHRFSAQELKILDNSLAKADLEYLPDAWGNNPDFKTEEISCNYMIQRIIIPQGTIFNIHFSAPVKGKDIELIGFNIGKHHKSSWAMQINNSASILFFETQTGSMLIPFDNYPSWLLNETITDITIKTNSHIEEVPVIKFYKRK